VGLAGGAATLPGTSVPSGTAVLPAQLSEEDRERIQKLINLIRTRNPYRSPRRALALPVPSLPAGRSETMIDTAFESRAGIHNLDIADTAYAQKDGRRGFETFGYDLFERAPSTFAPVTNVPVRRIHIGRATGSRFSCMEPRTGRCASRGPRRPHQLSGARPDQRERSLFSQMRDSLEKRVARQ